MKIHIVSDEEVKIWSASLGETFIPGSEESFVEFEAKYLTAYARIFNEIAKVASLMEDGESEGAHLSMSQWMEPDRLIGVAVENKAGLAPELLPAISSALKQLDEKFAVALDDYPTMVYVFPGDNVLVRRESNGCDLIALGLG